MMTFLPDGSSSTASRTQSFSAILWLTLGQVGKSLIVQSKQFPDNLAKSHLLNFKALIKEKFNILSYLIFLCFAVFKSSCLPFG